MYKYHIANITIKIGFTLPQSTSTINIIKSSQILTKYFLWVPSQRGLVNIFYKQINWRTIVMRMNFQYVFAVLPHKCSAESLSQWEKHETLEIKLAIACQ